MKTIYLLRHGKSSWDTDCASDHERPLTKRGRHAAATMGRLLARCGSIPQRVLTSSAVRARDTVTLAAEAGGWTSDVAIVPELYGSEPATVLERLRLEDDALASVLLAGHEPTWSELASGLIGGGVLRFPTAALARIDVDVPRWGDVAPGRGVLTWFVIPRMIAEICPD